MTRLIVDAKKAMPALADRLDRVSGSVIGTAARDAVNEVITRFERDATDGMTADYGLAPAYVRGKTDVRLADSILNPKAEMVTRGDLTILGRFPLQQLTQSAPRAKGDPSRGIAPGRKQAGVRATIRPHGLRHAGATEVAARGSLAALMSYGSWSSMTSASRYLDKREQHRAEALALTDL